MDTVNLRMPEEMIEALDEEAKRSDSTRAEIIRDAVEHRHVTPEVQDRYDSLREEYDELQAEYDTLRKEYESVEAEYEARIEEIQDEYETEIERLNRERRQLLEQREEHTDLVTVVERQQSLQEQRAQASIFKRMKWSITGMPSSD